MRHYLRANILRQMDSSLRQCHLWVSLVSMVTVSVLMPVFNGEKYLSAAIESILVQSLRDFELIIWAGPIKSDGWRLFACALLKPFGSQR